MIEKQNKSRILKFLFPYYPYKLTSSISLITTLAVLIALKVILGLFQIYIGPTFRISVQWIPIMIIGWYYGPVVGLFAGAAGDLISWLLSGGVWFWMYGIIEPLIGVMAAMIAYWYNCRNNCAKSLYVDMIVQQVAYLIFLGVGLSLIGMWINVDFLSELFASWGGEVTGLIIYWLSIAFIIAFFIVIEVIGFLQYRKSKGTNDHSNKYRLFIYISILSIFSSLIFSWAYGPLASIEYSEQVLGMPSSSFIKNGYGALLLPRILKEFIKTPVQIGILYSITLVLDHNWNTIIRNEGLKWKK